jgi:hypothetical protein
MRKLSRTILVVNLIGLFGILFGWRIRTNNASEDS